MSGKAWLAAAVLWLGAAVPLSAQEARPSPRPSPPVDPIKAAMDKQKRFTEPSGNHKLLERFLGRWATETRFFIFEVPTEPQKGTAEGAWLMKNRWLKLSWEGPIGMDRAEGLILMGYDNFRQNYVSTSVTSLDTAMTRVAGDTNDTRSALLLYGTIDEYETGEPDRLVKQLWRFDSPDKIVLEVYDMALGDTGAKVMDVAFLRQPAQPPAK